MMEFIHEPFEHPFEHPFHHHHHEVNPIELAQIGGASQYAKLSYRLQKHIEDDTRHITDEERYKWNKTYNDLKALKEDIEDGVVAGGISINDVRDYLESMNYATKTWVNEQGFLKDFDVQQLINLYLQNRGILTKDDLNSALKDYIKLKGYLGTIDGQPFYQGDAITTKGGDGITWTDIETGISWEGTYNAGVVLGRLNVGDHSYQIFSPKGGDGGSTVSFRQTNTSGWDTGAIYEIGTITIDGQQQTIYGKDSYAETGGGGEGNSVVKWTDMFFTLHDSNILPPEKPQSVNNTFVPTSVNGQVWTDSPHNPEDGLYVWVCYVTFTKNGNIRTCGPNDISNPICISGENGINGEDGVTTEFIYHTSTKPLEEYTESGWNTDPSDPWGLNNTYGKIGDSETTVINGQNDIYPDDFVPYGWTDNPSGIDSDNKYEYVAIRTCAIDENGKRTWKNRKFQGPLLWSKWGQDGLDGPGIEFIFSEPILVGTSSTDLDNWLTATLNRMYSATGVDKNYKDKQAYQDTQEVGPSLESYNGYSGSEKHWSDEPGSYEGYGPGYAIFASVRRLVYDQQEDKMKWSAFSVPLVWSNWANDGLPGPALGHYYNLSASPSVIKKTIDGKFIKGQGSQISYDDTIDVIVEMTETQVINDAEQTEKVWPTEQNGYTVWKSVNGGGFTPITNFDNVTHTYSLTIDDSVSQIALVWRSSSDALLATANVVVQVDGSVTSGADGLRVEMLNDSWSVGCDSENLITALSETSTVDIYEGTSKILMNSATYGATVIQSSQAAKTVTYSVGGGSISAQISISNDTLNIQSLSYTGYMSSHSINVPIVFNVTLLSGATTTCKTVLKLFRVNAGEKGAIPTMYKLNLDSDVITIDSQGVYSPNNISGNIQKYSNDGWVAIDSTDDDVTLYCIKDASGNNTGNIPNVNITTTGTYAGLFTINRSAYALKQDHGKWFTIGVRKNNIIYDSETIAYLQDGQDGQGYQGLQGCVIRTSLLSDGLQVANTVYRNDENLTFDSMDNATTRYIDVVAVADSTATGGYRWYKVKPASSGSRVIRASASTSYIKNVNTSTSTAYAQNQLSSAPASATADFEYLSDVGAIYASFILADYAKIKFLSNNELTVLDSNNNPVAGITGGGNTYAQYDPSASNVRIWAGDGSWYGGSGTNVVNLSGAAFKVYEDGSLEATKATITGNILASNKHIYLGECTEGPQWISGDYRTQGTDVIAIKDGNNDGTSIVIGSDPSDSGAINLINKDGSGHFANRNIKWNRVGNFQLGEIPTGSSNANAIELNQYAGAISVQSKLRDDGTGLRYTRTDIDRTGITYTATGQKNGVVQASDVELFHVQGDCTSDGIPTLNRGYGISVVGQLAANSQPKQYSGYSGTVNVGNVTLYFVNGLFVGTSDTGADPRSKQWLPDSIWDD